MNFSTRRCFFRALPLLPGQKRAISQKKIIKVRGKENTKERNTLTKTGFAGKKI